MSQNGVVKVRVAMPAKNPRSYHSEKQMQGIKGYFQNILLILIVLSVIPAVEETTVEDTPIEDPANITLDLIGPTTVNISWSMPTGANPKEKFTVYYSYHPEDMYRSTVQLQARNVITDKTYAVISDLQACDAYNFRVAVTRWGLRLLTLTVQQQTSHDNMAPPENLVFTPDSNNRTMGVLNWTASCWFDNDPTGYVVFMYSADNKMTKSSEPYINTSLVHLSLPLFNLVPGANYTFYVKNTYPGSRNSENLTVVIDKYAGPVGLEVNSTGSHGGRLHWAAAPYYPKDKFMGYEVMNCSQSIGASKCRGIGEAGYVHYAYTKEYNYLVTGLGSGMEHFFRVRFTTKDGHPSLMSNYGVIEIEVDNKTSWVPKNVVEVTEGDSVHFECHRAWAMHLSYSISFTIVTDDGRDCAAGHTPSSVCRPKQGPSSSTDVVAIQDFDLINVTNMQSGSYICRTVYLNKETTATIKVNVIKERKKEDPNYAWIAVVIAGLVVIIALVAFCLVKGRWPFRNQQRNGPSGNAVNDTSNTVMLSYTSKTNF